MSSFPYLFFLVEIKYCLYLLEHKWQRQCFLPLYTCRSELSCPMSAFQHQGSHAHSPCYVHASLPLLCSDCWHCLSIEEVDNVHKLKRAISRPQGFSLKKNGREKGKSPWGRDWATSSLNGPSQILPSSVKVLLSYFCYLSKPILSF